MTRNFWTNTAAVVLACAVFSGLSVYLARTSQSDLEADATTHFLIARYAPHEPAYFVGVWGRPLCTGVYALTAHLGNVDQGRLYTRYLSLGLAILCTLITLTIAIRQRFRWPALVVIMLLAQPLFFLHSFSELTEIPFTVLLMLAFLAYQRRQWLVMAIAVSLLPLGRPEGFGFILMAAVALVAHRRARWLWVLAVPFLTWSYAGWYLTTIRPPVVRWYWYFWNPDCWTWVIHNWPYSYESTYGRGPLFSFVARLPVLTSPLFFPFMIVGCVIAFYSLAAALGAEGRGEGENLKREDVKREKTDAFLTSSRLHVSHLHRCELLILLIPLSILVVHSLLWWRGKMGSNGELRYLLIVGPFFAMLAARGWEWSWQKFRWRIPLTFAGLCALLPIVANFQYRVVPFPLYDDGIVSREAADWYRSQPRLVADFPKIMPTLPQVFYYMDVSQSDESRAIPVCKQTVENPPHGALMLWDPIYGTTNSSADMCVPREMISRNGWILLRRFYVGDKYVEAYLSPKTVHGEDSRKKYAGETYLGEDPFFGN